MNIVNKKTQLNNLQFKRGSRTFVLFAPQDTHRVRREKKREFENMIFEYTCLETPKNLNFERRRITEEK